MKDSTLFFAFWLGGWFTMMWVGIGTAVAGVGGSLISANSASKSQAAANAANAKAAADTNAQNWNQYLLSRGVSTGSLPGVAAGNVNTVLPLGFTLNGAPAEQAILDRIFSASGGQYNTPGYATSAANIASFLQANPQVRTDLEAMLQQGNDTRSVEEWLAADVAGGDPNFTGQLQNHARQSLATYQSGLQLPPQYQGLLNYGPQTLDQLYGGDFLRQQLGAQDGINLARNNLAGTVQQGIDEQRVKYGNLNAGQLADLDRILSTRTTGSRGIYDAALTQADTYANAVRQATADELQKQRATRLTQGFVGEGSGDALLRARTMANGYQAAAGARALAGVDQATRLYGINDSDVTKRFDVNSSYLQTLAQLLDSAGASAKQGALLQNNTDLAAIINSDQSTRLANLNAPATLVGNRLQLDAAAASRPYNDINALLSSLGFFRQNQPSTPGTLTPNVGSVINSGQIAGAGLTAGASGLSTYLQNQQLINALRGVGGGSPAGGFGGAFGGPSTVSGFTGNYP